MILDQVPFTTKSVTPEGYLKGVAVLTCEGVQEYLGSEIQDTVDVPLNPDQIYGVYRPSSCFLNQKTLETTKLKPLTYMHPQGNEVNVDNYKRLNVGVMGESLQNVDDKQLAVNFMVTDPMIAKMIQEESPQVSLGYTSKLSKQSGTYDGKSYDFVFTGPMEINHLAILGNGVVGRCGNGAKILDQNFSKKGVNMTKIKRPIKKKANTKLSDSVAKALMTDGSPLLQMVGKQLVQEVLPTIKTMISSPEFQKTFTQGLVAQVAPTLTATDEDDDGMSYDQDVSGGLPEETTVPDTLDGMPTDTIDQDMSVEADEDEEDDMLEDERVEDEKMKGDGCTMKDEKAIKDSTVKILKIVDSARALNQEIEIDYDNPVGTLRKALKPYLGDSKGGSVDYLLGMADMVIAQRKKGAKSVKKIADINGSVKTNHPVLDGKIADQSMGYENIPHMPSLVELKNKKLKAERDVGAQRLEVLKKLLKET